jgi:hypothetical protein
LWPAAEGGKRSAPSERTTDWIRELGAIISRQPLVVARVDPLLPAAIADN